MKKLISLFVSFVLLSSTCGCVTPVADQPNEEFSQYVNELVIDIAESDYTTMHQYFENPEDYGIDPQKVKITLGDFESEEQTIQTFKRGSLDATQQIIYDHLQFSPESFDYMDSIWSSNNGIHQSLVQFFSEYIIRDASDIEPLLILIQDVPRYVDKAIEYSKKQAQHQTLMFDYDQVMEDCQAILDSREESAIVASLFEKVKPYQPESLPIIQEYMDTYFFPSYQKMMDALTDLKEEIQPLQGVSHFKNGRKYYESLVMDATGSEESVRTIQSNLEKDIEEKWKQIIEDEDLLEQPDIEAPFTSVDEILPFLEENYQSEFPELDTMIYDTIPLAKEQSQPGIMAYFLIPAIDQTSPYRIRYNETDYGNDPTSIEFYSTLAHEGIPGHMYQAQYNHEHFTYPIQFLLNNIGFTEGYATYIEMESLNFLDLDEKAKEAYILNTTLTNDYIALMDISIHYDGLSYNQFVEKYGDIFGEDLQGLYDQLCDNPATFLSYYYGYYQIKELKNEAQEKLKDKFVPVEFHEALLENGSVPFEIVEQSIDSYIQKKR